jgi:hypothetical protein
VVGIFEIISVVAMIYGAFKAFQLSDKGNGRLFFEPVSIGILAETLSPMMSNLFFSVDLALNPAVPQKKLGNLQLP